MTIPFLLLGAGWLLVTTAHVGVRRGISHGLFLLLVGAGLAYFLVGCVLLGVEVVLVDVSK